ncbi:hypothetical protein JMA_22340 [Jeotgalibacillus malaysiensis]|uniref:Uncharacterized protein n=1 Tax=Jeotgalibacillus malaysiensis TaxID=1508404 RepID=A0A0B5AN29_9BACL|nr:hypothetical protein [Jeotgalibacillus malaysiensis]AJD91551.1 hypothetical protein JMA_22340 [Jeotgalibacillus malaysiensis]
MLTAEEIQQMIENEIARYEALTETLQRAGVDTRFQSGAITALNHLQLLIEEEDTDAR